MAITILQFFFVTDADMKNLPPPPKGYVKPIVCEEDYENSIDKAITAAETAFNTGVVDKSIIYVQDNHYHVFFSAPDSCNKEIQTDLDVYVQYARNTSPYPLLQKPVTPTYTNPSNIGQSPSRQITFQNKVKS